MSYDFEKYQLKPGDDFIRISKYGHVFGVVKAITKSTEMRYNCNVCELKVVATTGVVFDYNECKKVFILNEEQKIERKKLLDNIAKLSELKSK